MTIRPDNIRSVTGGEPVTARELQRGGWTFRDGFKIQIDTNPKPRGDVQFRRIFTLSWPSQAAE